MPGRRIVASCLALVAMEVADWRKPTHAATRAFRKQPAGASKVEGVTPSHAEAPVRPPRLRTRVRVGGTCKPSELGFAPTAPVVDTHVPAPKKSSHAGKPPPEDESSGNDKGNRAKP